MLRSRALSRLNIKLLGTVQLPDRRSPHWWLLEYFKPWCNSPWVVQAGVEGTAAAAAGRDYSFRESPVIEGSRGRGGVHVGMST